MLPTLILMLSIGQVQEESIVAEQLEARIVIEQVRASIIIAEVQSNINIPDPLQQTPLREKQYTYKEMYDKAIVANMPLLVIVQQFGVTENSQYLYHYTESFSSVNRPATVISKPINGQLWWLTTLEGYDLNEINRILATPTSTFTPATSPIQQYFYPRVQMNNNTFGMNHRFGGICST